MNSKLTGVAVIAVVLLAVIGLGYVSRPSTLQERATTAALDTPVVVASSSEQAKLSEVDLAETPNTAENQATKLVALEVPDFELETTTGSTVRLSTLVADKPTLVGFWASWCPNCQRNLPLQNELYKKYANQVNVIEVNLHESKSAVDKYMKGKGYEFITAYDSTGQVARQWGVTYTNVHYLIASDGKLLDAFAGDVTEDHFKTLTH